MARKKSAAAKSQYRYAPLAHIEKYVPLMEKYGVSKVARSKRGFLAQYRDAGTARSLTPEWRARRDAFVARHIAQYNTNPTPRRALALLAWAYRPPGFAGLVRELEKADR